MPFLLGLLGKVPWLRIVGDVAIVAIIAYAGYRGYMWIYDRGYTGGVAAQTAIDKPILDKYAAEDADRNKKLAALETQSQVDAAKITDLQSKLTSVKTTVITKYIKSNPGVAKQCGLSKPTTDAYNSFLQQALH